MDDTSAQSIWYFIIINVLIFLFTLYYLFWKRSLKLPGPRGWPVIGNAFQVDPDFPASTYMSWAHQYGPVYAIRIFSSDVVMVSGPDEIQQVLDTADQDFGDRPKHWVREEIIHHQVELVYGCISPQWKKLKELTTKGFKNHGSKQESQVIKRITETIEILASLEGAPCDPNRILFEMVNDIIFIMTFGKKLTDEQNIQLNEIFQKFPYVMSSESIIAKAVEKIPLVRKLPFQFNKRLEELKGEYLPFYKKLVAEAGTSQCSIRDLLENVTKKSPSSKAQKLTEVDGTISMESVALSAANIVISGNANLHLSLYTALAVLAEHQDVQDQLSKLIKSTHGRQLVSGDLSSMPLMESFLWELMRCYLVMPFAIPHCTSRDTELGGCRVPKGVKVVCNLWALAHNPDIWDEPWKFHAKRFLNSKGKMLDSSHPLRKRLCVFGAGIRACPAAPTAMDQLSLILSLILHKFTILPAGDTDVATDARQFISGGIFYMPQPFRVKFELRDG